MYFTPQCFILIRPGKHARKFKTKENARVEINMNRPTQATGKFSMLRFKANPDTAGRTVLHTSLPE